MIPVFPTPYIMAYVSNEPKIVHLQLEVIRQDIQDTTSDYLVNIPTPNKNIMDTADETINYIEAFFQAYHYYLGPTATPTSQIS